MSATSPVVGRRCATDGNDRHTEVSTTPEATDPGVGAATLFAAGEQLDRRCVIVCVGIFLFAFFLVFWTGLNRADVKTLGCLCSSCVALASCIYAGLWRPSAYSPKTAFFARLGVVVFSCISIVLLHHTTMKVGHTATTLTPNHNNNNKIGIICTQERLVGPFFIGQGCMVFGAILSRGSSESAYRQDVIHQSQFESAQGSNRGSSHCLSHATLLELSSHLHILPRLPHPFLMDSPSFLFSKTLAESMAT